MESFILLCDVGPNRRVDYTGLSTINSQRFGQKFVGKVANPQDVLHWHKATAKKATTRVSHAHASPSRPFPSPGACLHPPAALASPI